MDDQPEKHTTQSLSNRQQIGNNFTFFIPCHTVAGNKKSKIITNLLYIGFTQWVLMVK